MTSLLRATAVGATLACAALGAQAQTVTLKLHHFLNTSSIQHAKMLRGWCDDIARDSGNRLQCQIFPSMQLGGTPAQLYDQARTGVADVIWTLPGYTAGRFPKMEVFELPFMMSSTEATSAAVWDYAEKHGKDEFKGVKLLATHVHGPGTIFTANRPAKTMADWKNLKLRAATRLTTKLIAAMGAVPVGMPVPAIPDSLSKGVIDGAVLPYQVGPSIKVDELTKFAAEPDPSGPGLYTSVFIMAMNPARYNSLPPDLQKVIDKNSGRAVSARFGKTVGDDDAVGKQKFLASKGNAVHIVPATEIAQWRKASEGVAQQWVEEMGKRGVDGKALIADAQALIAQHSRK